ncbi:hypothetical protein [Streptomyces sp. SID5473]|uniref:hypothetical protein n=1 Tax=Streptomyces sp. SID5473 TaxID=2690299 RepID=UPI001F39CD6F|nr:hypothetical protein [Streptomyces sp. SID5473]
MSSEPASGIHTAAVGSTNSATATAGTSLGLGRTRRSAVSANGASAPKSVSVPPITHALESTAPQYGTESASTAASAANRNHVPSGTASTAPS